MSKVCMIDWCDEVCEWVPGSVAFHGKTVCEKPVQIWLPDDLSLAETDFYDDDDLYDDDDDDDWLYADDDDDDDDVLDDDDDIDDDDIDDWLDDDDCENVRRCAI